MPFYPSVIAEALEANRASIEEYLEDDRDAVRQYAESLLDASTAWTAADIRAELNEEDYPGALPTGEFDNEPHMVVPFDESSGWTCHEDVNEWAIDVMADITTIAADGSNLGPVREFNVPLGLTQVASFINHHRAEGDSERIVDTQLLGPEDLFNETSDGVLYIDSQEVDRVRYEHEADICVECIERVAGQEPPPVIFYDGPLIVSFTNEMAQLIRRRYITAMSRILAASQYHQVPVVGYLSGSKANEVTKMLRRLDHRVLDDKQLVPDSRLFGHLMNNWGDRSILFESRRDSSIDALKTTYEGVDYEFSHDILFTYLNMPGTSASSVDRIELPRWIVDADLLEYTIDVVRAEAAIGRGYPEALQQADTDAVLDINAHQAFLRLIQNFADEYDLPINWGAKDLSKARRRRN